MASYRFGRFVLSQRRRALLCDGAVVPLIPKYFDLLRLLLARRDRALDRREIFECIWADVIVSDSALTQAIRTLRRALNDNPRTPHYIRTVSRHGYQFVFDPVILEEEDAPAVGRVDPPSVVPDSALVASEYDSLVARLLGADEYADASDDERLEAAEQLHARGTGEALARIADRAGHARATAYLREARWSVPNAGEVPLLQGRDPMATVTFLLALRLRGAARAAWRRLGAAAAGGALAGIAAGAAGGFALMAPDGSLVTTSTVVALSIVGGAAGLFGAAVIGAGLAAAEVLARSRRRLALVLCGGVSGLVAGVLARYGLEAVLGSVVGRSPGVLGGPFEGAVIGLAAGLGYAWSTHTPRGGGMATPRGRARLGVGLVTAVWCAAAAAGLGAIGATTVSVTLDNISNMYTGSQVGLEPLARLLGEQDLRPVTRSLASGFEGLTFGLGLALGLTYRPRRSKE